ncbi:MAG: hypothetical protein LBV23_05760, partial [Deltaproteobacteria bacterium]|nr:hypothetical protein [Deltaproteobacteria bacterium]
QSESLKKELEALIKNQSQALSEHKVWLAELAPMLAFFLQNGKDLWANEGQEDARDAVLFFLNRENAELNQELGLVKGEHQKLFFERRSYLDLNDNLRQRLVELEPLVKFFLQSFIQTTLDLANLTLERDSLAAKIAAASSGWQPTANAAAVSATGPTISPIDRNRVVSNGAASGAIGVSNRLKAPISQEIISFGQETQAPLAAEAAKARREAIKFDQENIKLKQALLESRQALDSLKIEAEGIKSEKNSLVYNLELKERQIEREKEQSAKYVQEIEEISQALERYLSQLSEARTENGKLSVEKENLRGELEKKVQQLEQALASKDEPPADGRLETAWAAMTYLSSKAGDALANLQANLDKRARELETAHLQLKERDEEIKRLERRQDNLSLLYWTMLSSLGDETSPAPDASLGPISESTTQSLEDAQTALETLNAPQSEEKESEKAIGGEKEESQVAPSAEQGKSERKGLLSGSLLAELRKAARRGLFSLALTGGLVLLAQSSKAETPLPLGGPDSPLILERAFSDGTKSSQVILTQAHYQPNTSALVIDIPLSRLNSKLLARNVDLGFPVPRSFERSYPDRVDLCREIIESQAKRWDLTGEDWIRLIQMAYGPEETVFLGDLNGRLAPVLLTRPYLKNLSQAMEDKTLEETLGQRLLKSVLCFSGPEEGPYWDRLFVNFRRTLGNDSEAVSAVIWHLFRRPARIKLSQIEYGGYQRPFNSFEKMDIKKALEFLTEHIKQDWGRPASKPRQRKFKMTPAESAVLASDLIFTARLYGLPRTTLVALAADDFISYGVWPDALQAYSYGQKLSQLMILSAVHWKVGAPAVLEIQNLTDYMSLGRKDTQGVRKAYCLLDKALSRYLTPQLSIFKG